MRLTLMWPLVLALVSACSLVNDPSDLQNGDAGARDSGEGPDTSPPDVGTDTGAMDAGDDVGPTPDAGPAPLTAEEYCQQYAALMCAANEDCCDTPTGFTNCETVLAQ